MTDEPINRKMERVLQLQEHAWTLHAERRFGEALAACDEALRLAQESEGPDSLDVANLLNEAAEIERDRQHFDAASAWLERARTIEEALGDYAIGEDVARIRLRTSGLLGEIRRIQGEYPSAEGDLRRALTIAETELGDASDEAATARNNLAVLYKYWGRFDEGLRLYERALASTIATHGEESLATSVIYHNIGGILHARGEFMAAEAPGRRAWEISRRLLGDDDPRVMLDATAYAAILDGLERYDESEPIYRAALSIYEKALGPEHGELAMTSHNLAAVLAARGDHAGAEEHYRRALAIEERVFGIDGPDVALTSNNLGRLLIEQGRYREGIALLERAVAILERRIGPEHPHLASARDNLARAVAESPGDGGSQARDRSSSGDDDHEHARQP
jgi:tetratricopeptide (TPR) repeat protein